MPADHQNRMRHDVQVVEQGRHRSWPFHVDLASGMAKNDLHEPITTAARPTARDNTIPSTTSQITTFFNVSFSMPVLYAPSGRSLSTHAARRYGTNADVSNYAGSMQLGRFALQSTLKGLRTGDARLLLIGAALLGFSWLRKPRGDALVYKRRLRPGDALEIRLEPQER